LLSEESKQQAKCFNFASSTALLNLIVIFSQLAGKGKIKPPCLLFFFRHLSQSMGEEFMGDRIGEGFLERECIVNDEV